MRGKFKYESYSIRNKRGERELGLFFRFSFDFFVFMDFLYAT